METNQIICTVSGRLDHCPETVFEHFLALFKSFLQCFLLQILNLLFKLTIRTAPSLFPSCIMQKTRLKESHLHMHYPNQISRLQQNGIFDTSMPSFLGIHYTLSSLFSTENSTESSIFPFPFFNLGRMISLSQIEES